MRRCTQQQRSNSNLKLCFVHYKSYLMDCKVLQLWEKTELGVTTFGWSDLHSHLFCVKNSGLLYKTLCSVTHPSVFVVQSPLYYSGVACSTCLLILGKTLCHLNTMYDSSAFSFHHLHHLTYLNICYGYLPSSYSVCWNLSMCWMPLTVLSLQACFYVHICITCISISCQSCFFFFACKD